MSADDVPPEFDAATFGRVKNDDPLKPCDGYFGTMDDRNLGEDKCWARLGAKQLVYRYALFANYVPKAAGKGEFGGDDLFVSYGGLTAKQLPYLGGNCVTGPCHGLHRQN